VEPRRRVVCEPGERRRQWLRLVVISQCREIAAPIDVSYLAESLILMRFFEAEEAVRQAISVVKKPRRGERERRRRSRGDLSSETSERSALSA
jgi:hypothetical protein